MSGTVIDTNDGTADAPIAATSNVFDPNVTYTVTKDSGTPAGQDPTVYFTADAIAGTVNITSENGAVVYVTEEAGVFGTYNMTADGGTLILNPSGVQAGDTNNYTITGNGTLETAGTLVGAANGGVIDFGTGSNTLIISSNGSAVNLSTPAAITNFQQGDTVIDQDINYSQVASYTITNAGNGDQTVTFKDGSGNTLGTLTFAGGTFPAPGTYASTAGPLSINNGPSGALELDACFLRGTHIAAETKGIPAEIRVEDLRIGDLVATLVNGAIVMRPVQWIGKRSVALAGQGPDAYPVRIRAGAFSDNIPHRDLLVTPEHCVFVDGVFIPARMLLNGGSIIEDRSIAAYTYYHIELAEHAVLIAEGLTSESYLDTGNRRSFTNAILADLQPRRDGALDKKTWSAHAAAPLTVDRATVEPVWRFLAARSGACGFLVNRPGSDLTFDPAVYLVTDSGQDIRPSQIIGQTYSFMLPGGTKTLRLVSRGARPCDVVGPFLDDRRMLGVLVGGMSLSGVSQPDLADEEVPGWHLPEPGMTARWTDGDAVLPVDLTGLRGRPARLEITILNAGPYPATAAHIKRAA